MTRSVFLSFKIEDKPLVESFVHQIKQRLPSWEFRDYAIKESYEIDWKTHCEELIQNCNIVLCLIGLETSKSSPVDWEIRRSVELEKSIMAVYLVDNAPLPPVLRDFNIIPSKWQIEIIVNSLKLLAYK